MTKGTIRSINITRSKHRLAQAEVGYFKFCDFHLHDIWFSACRQLPAGWDARKQVPSSFVFEDQYAE